MVNPRHQTRQGQSVAKPGTPSVEYHSRECKHDIKESEGNMFNPIFKDNVQGGNIKDVAHLRNQYYLVSEIYSSNWKE